MQPGSGRRRPPLVSIKDIAWFFYLYPIRFLGSRLSADSLYRFGRLVEPVFQVVVLRRKHIAQQRMALALSPGRTEADIAALQRRFVANAIWRALDDVHLADPVAAARQRPPEVHGLEYLDRAISAGKGVIVISGHFYANRLGKYHLARMGYPLMSVRHGQPPDEWMGRLGARFLQPRYVEFLRGVVRDEVFIQDPACALKIFHRLRSGGLVNVHVDSAFSPNRTSVRFLGRPRGFATGVLEIVRLSGCAVIPMLCLGNQRGSSVTFGERLDLQPATSRQEFVTLNLQKVVSSLERQILEHPDQWESWVRL